MAYVYCIDLKEGDVKTGSVCVPIEMNLPWPWDIWVKILRRIDDPEPAPWVIDDQLDQIVMQELTILATIDQLASSLNPTTRRGVQQHIKKTIEQIELPEGRRVQRR
jgi:hypothetical protein